ncbi:MAG: SBBP repeat-containing protein, partial [Nannocystaceae bacterium]
MAWKRRCAEWRAPGRRWLRGVALLAIFIDGCADDPEGMEDDGSSMAGDAGETTPPSGTTDPPDDGGDGDGDGSGDGSGDGDDDCEEFVDEAHGVVTDAPGNVFITGSTTRSLDSQTHYGLEDAFLTKYNAAGVKQWTRQFGSSYRDIPRDLAIDSAGNLYVAGETNGTIDGQSNAGGFDAFLTKYSANGTKQWTRVIGTSTPDVANGVATDAAGNIYIAGSTEYELDGQNYMGFTDRFLVKYDSDGLKQWTKQLGTINFDHATSVFADDAGYVYTAGYSAHSIDGQASEGMGDAFLTKWEDTGDRVWTVQLGTITRDIAMDVLAD